ncbi:hypothetical protein RCL1_001947 [Eukaryota sp. TZLM3-RCL]
MSLPDHILTLEELQEHVNYLSTQYSEKLSSFQHHFQSNLSELSPLISNYHTAQVLTEKVSNKIDSFSLEISHNSSSISSTPRLLTETLNEYNSISDVSSLSSSIAPLAESPSIIRACIQSNELLLAAQIGSQFKLIKNQMKLSEKGSEMINSLWSEITIVLTDLYISKLKALEYGQINSSKSQDFEHFLLILRELSLCLSKDGQEFSNQLELESEIFKLFLKGRTRLLTNILTNFSQKTPSFSIIFETVDKLSASIKQTLKISKEIFVVTNPDLMQKEDEFSYKLSKIYTENSGLLDEFVLNFINAVVSTFSQFLNKSKFDFNQSLTIFSELLSLSKFLSNFGFDFLHLLLPIISEFSSRNIQMYLFKSYENLVTLLDSNSDLIKDITITESFPESFSSFPLLIRVFDDVIQLFNNFKAVCSLLLIDSLIDGVKVYLTKVRKIHTKISENLTFFDESFLPFLKSWIENHLKNSLDFTYLVSLTISV